MLCAQSTVRNNTQKKHRKTTSKCSLKSFARLLEHVFGACVFEVVVYFMTSTRPFRIYMCIFILSIDIYVCVLENIFGWPRVTHRARLLICVVQAEVEIVWHLGWLYEFITLTKNGLIACEGLLLNEYRAHLITILSMLFTTDTYHLEAAQYRILSNQIAAERCIYCRSMQICN